MRLRDKVAFISGATVDGYCRNSGILDSVSPDALLVECGTIDIGSLDRLLAEASRRGVQVVDVPETGGIEGAEAGTLTFMVGDTDASSSCSNPCSISWV